MTHLFITDSDFSCAHRIFEYLLGFQPSLGAMILSNSGLKVLLDGRYIEKAKDINTTILRERFGDKDMKIDYICIEEFLAGIISELEDEVEISIEENIAIKYIEEIREKYPKMNIFVQNHPVNEKREIKNQDEQNYIKKAIAIIDKVFLYIQRLSKAGNLQGQTELQVQGIIVAKIFELGGEGESFSSIVAFGVNSAVPHHNSGDTIISDGPLLIDMGAKYRGYCSDFTRTFWVGRKTDIYEKFTEISHIVADAHESAYTKYSTDMTGKDLDTISREVISSAGYSEYYTHGLGHGVGLDIHEKPKISKKGAEPLKQGMIFTIEPGIYISGEFGVRLEDIVFLQGARLKKYSKIPLLINKL